MLNRSNIKRPAPTASLVEPDCDGHPPVTKRTKKVHLPSSVATASALLSLKDLAGSLLQGSSPAVTRLGTKSVAATTASASPSIKPIPTKNAIRLGSSWNFGDQYNAVSDDEDGLLTQPPYTIRNYGKGSLQTIANDQLKPCYPSSHRGFPSFARPLPAPPLLVRFTPPDGKEGQMGCEKSAEKTV